MAPVIAYARGEYATDLLKGRSDPQALARIVDRVTELTGLDQTFVQRSGGRIESAPSCARSTAKGNIGSVYDSNVTVVRPVSVRARRSAATTRCSKASSRRRPRRWSTSSRASSAGT